MQSWRNLFNDAAGTGGGGDNTPPETPEVRRLPDFAKKLKSPCDKWITGQVFKDKGNKDRRVYYAAIYPNAETKQCRIVEYSYNIKMDGIAPRLHNNHDDYRIEDAIRAIIQIEQTLQKNGGCTPVEGLQGNYREVAGQRGIYLDDRGNMKSIQKDALITDDVLLERKNLKSLYSKPKDKQASSTISTWDDYYRKIVHERPLDELPVPYQSNVRSVLDEIKAFEQIAMDENISAQKKHDAFWALATFDLPFGSGAENAGYQYNVTLLTTMMRAGGRVYRQFATSFTDSAGKLLLLEEISKTVHYLAVDRLRLSPDQAKQVADVMMQGPDPYADRLLPLEKLAHKAPSKNQPKPHP